MFIYGDMLYICMLHIICLVVADESELEQSQYYNYSPTDWLPQSGKLADTQIEIEIYKEKEIDR